MRTKRIRRYIETQGTIFAKVQIKKTFWHRFVFRQTLLWVCVCAHCECEDTSIVLRVRRSSARWGTQKINEPLDCSTFVCENISSWTRKQNFVASTDSLIQRFKWLKIATFLARRTHGEVATEKIYHRQNRIRKHSWLMGKWKKRNKYFPLEINRSFFINSHKSQWLKWIYYRWINFTCLIAQRRNFVSHSPNALRFFIFLLLSCTFFPFAANELHSFHSFAVAKYISSAFPATNESNAHTAHTRTHLRVINPLAVAIICIFVSS